jgi:hypothetical protein
MRTHPLQADAPFMTEAAPQVRDEIRTRGRLSETLVAAFRTMHAEAQGAEWHGWALVLRFGFFWAADRRRRVPRRDEPPYPGGRMTVGWR